MPGGEDDEMVFEFLDLSRAHLHALIERLIFVSIRRDGSQAWTDNVRLAGAAFFIARAAALQRRLAVSLAFLHSAC